MKTAPELPCPCGSVSYASCCQPLHQGTPAPSPERLMRSRYSAFVLGDQNYLLCTWHPDTRPAHIEFVPGMKWLGLTIVNASAIAVDAQGQSRATVEFIARYRVGGASAARLHERSRFVLAERWLYVDGDVQH